MRPNLVVVASPTFNNDLRLPQGVKDFSIEQFVPELAIEALVVAVLPGTAWLDEEGLHPKPLQPVPDRKGSELRTIV